MTSFCFVSPCAETIRACLNGGGGPQIGEVTCGWSPHLSRKRNQITKVSYHTYLRSPTSMKTGPQNAISPLQSFNEALE